MHNGLLSTFLIPILLLASTQHPAPEKVRYSSLRISALHKKLLQSEALTQQESAGNISWALSMGGVDLPLSYLIAEDSSSLSHLGLRLMENSALTGHERLLWQAAERELLDLLLSSGSWLDLSFRINRARGIIWRYHGAELGLLNRPTKAELIRLIHSAPRPTLTIRPDNFTFSWGEDPLSLSLILPLRQDVLLGLDKREWESHFTRYLQKLASGPAASLASSHAPHTARPPWPGYTGSAIVENHGSQPRIIFDIDHFSASLVNAILAPDSLGIYIQSSVSIRLADTTQVVTAPWNTLLVRLQEEHFLWVGIDKISDTRIEFHLLVQHRTFSHAHLFTSSLEKDELFLDGPLNIRFKAIPNIRQDNLRTFFPDPSKIGAHGDPEFMPQAPSID